MATSLCSICTSVPCAWPVQVCSLFECGFVLSTDPTFTVPTSSPSGSETTCTYTVCHMWCLHTTVVCTLTHVIPSSYDMWNNSTYLLSSVPCSCVHANSCSMCDRTNQIRTHYRSIRTVEGCITIPVFCMCTSLCVLVCICSAVIALLSISHNCPHLNSQSIATVQG